MVLEFPILADYAWLYVPKKDGRERMVFVTHGHVHNEAKVPMLKNGDVLLHGHTHVPVCREHETYIYMNPGSVSIPKEESAHSYLMMEKGIFTWKNLNGEAYQTYCFV
jgi:predicted phosphodiesterase